MSLRTAISRTSKSPALLFLSQTSQKGEREAGCRQRLLAFTVLTNRMTATRPARNDDTDATNSMKNNPTNVEVSSMWVSEIPEEKVVLSQQLQKEYDDWLARPGNKVTTYRPGQTSGVIDKIESDRQRNRRCRKYHEEHHEEMEID